MDSRLRGNDAGKLHGDDLVSVDSRLHGNDARMGRQVLITRLPRHPDFAADNPMKRVKLGFVFV